jgi:hypothetical protein
MHNGIILYKNETNNILGKVIVAAPGKLLIVFGK